MDLWRMRDITVLAVRESCFCCGAGGPTTNSQGRSFFYAQARAQAEREIREVLNRVLEPNPKPRLGRRLTTSLNHLLRQSQRLLRARVPLQMLTQMVQAALDMLAALLPQELMVVSQEQLKPRVVPPISRTRHLADFMKSW